MYRFLLPLQMCFAKRFSVLRERTANFTDRRVKLTGELVNGIGTVKTFGWEQPYIERVGHIRTSERHSILRAQIMRAVNLAIYFAKGCFGRCLSGNCRQLLAGVVLFSHGA